VEADAADVERLLKELEGKDINELIAAGREKLQSVPSGGAAVAAAPAAGGAAGGAAPAKEEKKEEPSEEDEVRGGCGGSMGRNLQWGDGGGVAVDVATVWMSACVTAGQWLQHLSVCSYAVCLSR
jgi:ribosomal protein L12E/L44/L45/RPP1/RPP2